ncbi:MAG: YfiR/HmsC family protein [Candidatus Sedimenticola sp. 20ELBAFRAG]
MRSLLLLLCLLAAAQTTGLAVENQQFTRDKLVAVYIFRLAEHVQWANENRIGQYRIHLIGAGRKVVRQLQGIGKIKQLHGKPIQVSSSRDVEVPKDAHLIYVSPRHVNVYGDIFRQVEGDNILLISDGLTDKRLAMINLLEGGEKQINFEINKANLLNQNLGVKPDIILLGGTEIDVARLYREGQASLRQQEQRVAELDRERERLESTLNRVRHESETLQQRLGAQEKQLASQSSQLVKQERLIKEKEKAVKAEQQRLTEAIANSREQQKVIERQKRQVAREQARYESLAQESASQQRIIAEQHKQVEAEQRRLQQAVAQVATQKALIQKQQARLAEEETRYRSLEEKSAEQQALIERQRLLVAQEQEQYRQLTAEVRQREQDLALQEQKIEKRAAILSEQDQKIADQQEILDRQSDTIATQQNFLYALTAVIVLVVLLAMALLRGYRNKRAANAKLLEQKSMLEASAVELSKAKDIAETANKAKSIFLANMSHELRTPLNAVLGFSQLMSTDEAIPPHQKSNLDIINRSGHHLLQLINDVLDMSKIEAGKIQLEPEDMDLGALILDVTDMIRVRAEEKGLQLLLDQSSDFPRYVRADGPKIRQILINLLSNAVKFTEQGGVTLRLESRNGQPDIITLRGEVQDTGRGIGTEDIKRIFQPFEQLASAIEQKGTGLGLAITRQFVELMGGEISAASQPGKGTTFYFSIQVAPGNPEQVQIIDDTEGRRVLGLEPPEQEWRILVAEDQLENQLLLQQLLEQAGFEVRVAEDGEQTVELFQQWHPHFIWMDRRMPRMDGLTATRKIRELPGGKEVKIAALTASVFKEQKDEVMAAGSDDFVRKPYRPDEIFDCMARHLDLAYIYEEEGETDETEIGLPSSVTPEAVAALPPDLLKELRRVVTILDIEETRMVLERVAEVDSDLAASLSRLADSFNFQAINNLLNP